MFRGLAPVGDADLGLFSKTLEIDRQPVMDVDVARREWEADPAESEGLSRYYYWLAQTYRDLPPGLFELHVVTIGSAALIHMPGEPFVETAFAIREAAPFEKVLLFCNPCPETGYLPTPEARREGDGEVLFAPLEMESETEIKEGAIALLKEAGSGSGNGL